MNKKYVLGIAGGGNMATAIINGIISNNGIINPNQIIISDIDEDKLKLLRLKGINTTSDNTEVFNNSEYILFAVKPQIFLTMDNFLAIESEQHIISIMAGISIDTIRKAVGKDIAICRVMPNTPCMIGYGMSVLCYHNFNGESKAIVEKIFASIGEITEMSEDAFDAVTSISGSGPAYIYSFIDAMVKGGMEGGLSETDSRKLAIATTIGAANMIKANEDKSIDELINAVCSKGGTTIEAIDSYREENLEGIIIKGIRACRNRSKELSGK